MSNYFYYSAKTAHGNLGDSIIARELLNILKKMGELIIDDRGSPDFHIDILNVNKSNLVTSGSTGFKRSMILTALKSLLTSNQVFLVLKPGHIFGGGSKMREIAYVSFLILLTLLKVKVIRVGVSLGPFSNTGLFFEKIKSFFMHFHSAREDISIEYMKSNGISKLKYFPDLALFLTNQFESKIKKFDFCLSFRTGTISDNDEAYVKALEEKIGKSKFISSENLSSCFVAQVDRDKKYVAYLKKNIRPDAQLFTYDNTLSSAVDIFKIYGKVRFCISNRLHVLLFAASQGALPIPLINKLEHTKITGIFKKVGLETLIFDVGSDFDLDEHILHIINHEVYFSRLVSLAFSSADSTELTAFIDNN